MKKLFCLSLCLLIPHLAGAQDRVQRVVDIKNGSIDQIARAVKPLSEFLVLTTEGNHILLSGPKANVDGIEAVIKQLDVPAQPKPNVELTVYMIAASTQASSAGPLPDELAPVTTQLKAVFPYKGFHVIDSFILRVRSGERGQTSGFTTLKSSTNVPAPGDKVSYGFQFDRLTVENQGERPLIRIGNLKLDLRVPVFTSPKGDIQYMTPGIHTDVDIHEGQKVVVGKTSGLEGPDGALFLAISAKLVQ